MIKTIYKPSPKMRAAYHGATLAKFRLLCGAVRSSKTYTANDIALREIQALPPCNVLISGHSINTAGRNILGEWRQAIDPHGRLFRRHYDTKDDFMTINWRGLRGKRFYVRGASKETDFESIQGATFGYWVGDELTRHAESFVDMAMTRLSPPFAKGLFTTNPDSPYHYVKQRLIDNEKLYATDAAGSSLWKRWDFVIGDNPSLTPDYREMLERMYSGMFYDRYIRGLWTMAEGLVYEFFVDAGAGSHVIEEPPCKATTYSLTVDYGTSNPTAAILMGETYTGRPRCWAEREYYYDPDEHSGRSRTDEQHSKEIRKWLGDVKPQAVYIDPSAASFKAQLEHDGFANIISAEHAVKDGIRTHARMLQTGDYRICRCCTNTRKEYGAYMWDKKAQRKGEDAPIKQRDHCKDAERYYLHTKYGYEGNIDYNAFTKW